MERANNMNKLEDILQAVKLNEMMGKKKHHIIEKEKKCNKVLWVLAVVGAVVAVAGIAYAVYRYFTPDYLEDFEDNFDDEFDDEFFEEEESPESLEE